VKRAYPIVNYCIVLLFLCSCGSTRQAIYFNIQKDSITHIQPLTAETLIQKNDLLSITVSSRSEEESQRYNMPNTVAGSGANATPGGYLVNEEGNVLFPGIGTIKAAGLTKRQLEQDITARFLEQKLLLDPIVSIRNLNYKVTVLGEVQRPTVINVPSEKINLLEALGFAGDLTIYGNRKNVLLIREEANQRTFKVINLNSAEIFSSPYFYLKPNDIIYVEPNKTKISSASATRQWLPIVLSGLTFVTLAVDRIYRNIVE
jgi:polysaccharide export outer membrane protein